VLLIFEHFGEVVGGTVVPDKGPIRPRLSTCVVNLNQYSRLNTDHQSPSAAGFLPSVDRHGDASEQLCTETPIAFDPRRLRVEGGICLLPTLPPFALRWIRRNAKEITRKRVQITVPRIDILEPGLTIPYLGPPISYNLRAADEERGLKASSGGVVTILEAC